MAKDAMIKGTKKGPLAKLNPMAKPPSGDQTVQSMLKPLKGGTTRRTMGDNIKKKANEANPDNTRELGLNVKKGKR